MRRSCEPADVRLRRLGDPGAHGDDLDGYLSAESIAIDTSELCGLGEFNATVGPGAAVFVQPVVQTRQRTAAKPVGDEIDVPVDDALRPTQGTVEETLGGRHTVEAEPHVGSWRPHRDDGIETVRPRRTIRKSSHPGDGGAVLDDLQSVLARSVGRQRVGDRRHSACSSFDEETCEGLRWAVGESVRSDHEIRTGDAGGRGRRVGPPTAHGRHTTMSFSVVAGAVGRWAVTSAETTSRVGYPFVPSNSRASSIKTKWGTGEARTASSSLRIGHRRPCLPSLRRSSDRRARRRQVRPAPLRSC